MKLLYASWLATVRNCVAVHRLRNIFVCVGVWAYLWVVFQVKPPISIRFCYKSLNMQNINGTQEIQKTNIFQLRACVCTCRPLQQESVFGADTLYMYCRLSAESTVNTPINDRASPANRPLGLYLMQRGQFSTLLPVADPGGESGHAPFSLAIDEEILGNISP